MSTGVTQGAVLFPLLFVIYLDLVLSKDHKWYSFEQLQLLSYEGDIASWEISKDLEQALNIMYSYFRKAGMIMILD